MFDPNPNKLLQTNLAGIFLNSLVEIRAKLASIPSVLILLAPRHSRSQRSYRYIIPDRHITLDHNVVQFVCLQCGKTNDDSESWREFYYCPQCFALDSRSAPSTSTNATVMCYCGGCLEKIHQAEHQKDRVEHVPKRMKETKYKLNLFAVLCIETSHYVAFVKCHKQDGQHEWVFFDSMSDRVQNEKNIPCVSRLPNFDQWIDNAEKDKYFFEELDRRRQSGKPQSQEFKEDGMRQLRLFRDGAFFFYENSTADYQ
jgi:ubiquitin thioesterase CYLD